MLLFCSFFLLLHQVVSYELISQHALLFKCCIMWFYTLCVWICTWQFYNLHWLFCYLTINLTILFLMSYYTRHGLSFILFTIVCKMGKERKIQDLIVFICLWSNVITSCQKWPSKQMNEWNSAHHVSLLFHWNVEIIDCVCWMESTDCHSWFFIHKQELTYMLLFIFFTVWVFLGFAS